MRRLSLRGVSSGLRARRWDVVILGSAPPGLFAGARFATLGLRVLIVEEEGPSRDEPLLREPFFFGCSGGSPLDEALKAGGITPVDRRGLEASDIAYQVILENARIDVAGVARCADDWVAYGLAKPDEARALARELDVAGRAEAEALLSEAPVRPPPKRSPARIPTQPGLRGLPAGIHDVDADLQRFFEAQVEALSVGAVAPTPECRARLLGAPFGGGGYFARPGLSLTGLLRQRISKVHGEFRQLSGPFELVEIGGHPGLSPQTRDEAWLGRVMILNTPTGRLAQCLSNWEVSVPRGLAGEIPTRRHLSVLFRGDRQLFPEALHPRAILAAEADGPALALSLFPSQRSPGSTELVARATVADDADLAEEADRVEESLRRFLPFSEGRLARVAQSERGTWDDPEALGEAKPSEGWPSPVSLRLPGRQPIYALPRAGFGGLGLDGDAILGWRGAEALAPSP